MVDEIPDGNPQRDILISVSLQIFLFLLIVAGFFGLTRLGGFTEEIDKLRFQVFSILIILFILMMLIFKIGKHTFLKGTSIAQHIYIPIHDHELGFLGFLPFVRSAVQLTVMSIIFFSILGFVGSISPQSSAYIFPLGAGQVAQQTTPTGKLLFGFYNAPAENVFLYIILFTAISFWLYFATHKLGLPFKVALGIAIIPIALFAAFIWREIHFLVSGSSEIRSFSNVLFGFNGAFLTILTGSVIPFEVYHITNNLFITSRTIFGSEITIVIFAALMILSIAGTAIYYGLKSRRSIPQ